MMLTLNVIDVGTLRYLADLGMKVSAVARMCQSTDVWKAMFISGTPCPILSQR